MPARKAIFIDAVARLDTVGPRTIFKTKASTVEQAVKLATAIAAPIARFLLFLAAHLKLQMLEILVDLLSTPSVPRDSAVRGATSVEPERISVEAPIGVSLNGESALSWEELVKNGQGIRISTSYLRILGC